MAIKVLIVDDHQITREGIRSMLEQEPDMKVLGEAEDGRSATRMARELGPDPERSGNGGSVSRP
jgi:DNA-binding NarL/FixJ family response regulator